MGVGVCVGVGGGLIAVVCFSGLGSAREGKAPPAEPLSVRHRGVSPA